MCEYIQISVSPGGEVERIVLVAPGDEVGRRIQFNVSSEDEVGKRVHSLWCLMVTRLEEYTSSTGHEVASIYSANPSFQPRIQWTLQYAVIPTSYPIDGEVYTPSNPVPSSRPVTRLMGSLYYDDVTLMAAVIV